MPVTPEQQRPRQQQQQRQQPWQHPCCAAGVLSSAPCPSLPATPPTGGSFYDRTVIELNKGERFFCTAVEAEAAGWRASRS